MIQSGSTGWDILLLGSSQLFLPAAGRIRILSDLVLSMDLSKETNLPDRSDPDSGLVFALTIRSVPDFGLMFALYIRSVPDFSGLLFFKLSGRFRILFTGARWPFISVYFPVCIL